DFKLLKKIGQGGMGAVYKACWVSQNDRIVAIKVLSKELSNKEAFVQRFLREARVMSKLDHPNVLRCFDVGHNKNYHYLAIKFVDCRVDIYALGVMLYVFLTGQPPFQGTTLVEVITAKEKGKFDPIRKFNGEVPSKLDLIVDKMLAKEPKHRYASCAEVIAAL